MVFDVQRMVDAMNDLSKDTRSGYHLTLGQAIEQLEKLDPDLPIFFDWNRNHPSRPQSYRGHYSDLAIGFTAAQSYHVREMLISLRGVLGKTLEGYKGGDIIMDADTPLWAANYGDTGRAIIGIESSPDAVIFVTKQVD